MLLSGCIVTIPLLLQLLFVGSDRHQLAMAEPTTMVKSQLMDVGLNKFSGMLMARGKPNWGLPVMVYRFVEENGVSTNFILTNLAMEQFSCLEEYKIYDMEFPGTCVRTSRSLAKTGIQKSFEVCINYPLKKLVKSERSWPLKRKGSEGLEDIGDEEPKRKVLKVSLPDPKLVKDIDTVIAKLLRKNQLAMAEPTTMVKSQLMDVGLNKFSGMLMARGKPNWGLPVMVYRFVEENGVSTNFILTNLAMEQFSCLEEYKIYDMEFPGTCVRTSRSLAKTGIQKSFEVCINYPLKKLVKSERSWPLKRKGSEGLEDIGDEEPKRKVLKVSLLDPKLVKDIDMEQTTLFAFVL